MRNKFVNLVVSVIALNLYGCGGGSGGGAGVGAAIEAENSVNQAPSTFTLTLIGPDIFNHELGTVFVDPGATARDAAGKSVTVTTTGTVGTEAGSYSLSYSAADNAGNSATRSRTVIVSDTTDPVLTLVGAATMNHQLGSLFTDPGAVAQDVGDGTLAVETLGSVGTEVGTYILTYSATDSAGNSATTTRTVTVQSAPLENDSTDQMVFSNGLVDSVWDAGISAFDAAIGFGECNNDGGAGCPSISWSIVADSERGDVLQIAHTSAGDLAGVFIETNSPLDASGFSAGSVVFDINVVSGDSGITMKLDCVFPCTSGDQALGSKGSAGWETVTVPFSVLIKGGLDVRKISTGIVIWATQSKSTVFQIDNVRFTGFDDSVQPSTGDYTITAYGSGSISDSINRDSYRCVYDYGNWIYNAGVVEPGIAGCDTTSGIPIGEPVPRSPQLTGSAAEGPTPTHRWWGSVPFLGEMKVGAPSDAAYITPDPIIARITNKGVRVMGIPSGLKTQGDGFGYQIPDPFSEVFDGVAVGNTDFSNMEAYLKHHSDGSMTVEWRQNEAAIMQATFVHGSPYVYFKAYQGEISIRTLRSDGNEKGIFYEQANSLGVWTRVAGNHNNFLVTGEGDTSFRNVSGNNITVSNEAKALTLTYLPETAGLPSNTLTSFFGAKARAVVKTVEIGFEMNPSNGEVTVSHAYLDEQGVAIETIVGLHPLHWKFSELETSAHQVRSARGTLKFMQTDSFDYRLPSVGVLPALPALDGTFDVAALEALVKDFVAQGPSLWNDQTNTYWAGKNYGKVAELAAIADLVNMHAEATQLVDWLKSELSDWFTAESNGNLDVKKYFVYDEQWNTLLGIEESFQAHQQLNDHHFHYGYFVRAAAEICRQDASWCGQDQYGPMIELLIRDYAGGRDDPMFPYLRNFDPANGFSWASGNANFVRGNNNESVSEAANAYGAIVLYGLITGRDDLVERGMYLHASTAAAFWQYWNNVDGYNNAAPEKDNFPDGYDRITTSIIWGDGTAFATWFSGAYAHILGIQGLPSNALMLYVGQFSDYLHDYVALGLSESSNSKPSGLPDDQWRDLWWNLWAMTDPEAAIADYNSVTNYVPEAGETKAHTYFWIHTLANLGTPKTGTGELTANHPSAIAFDNNGVTSYVVYNFTGSEQSVMFSNGVEVKAAPYGFTVVRQ